MDVVDGTEEYFEECRSVLNSISKMREPLFGVFITSNTLYETYPCRVTCNQSMQPPPTSTTVVVRFVVVVVVDTTSVVLVTKTNCWKERKVDILSSSTIVFLHWKYDEFLVCEKADADFGP